MAKRSRVILFLTCMILFILGAPTVVLYSQGYRFDLNPPAGGKIITQTGGIFLKIEPKQVEVFVDGKLIKKTDFLFGSVFIDDLLPKKYKVEVKKEGYFPWEKDLEIKERWVTENKNIVLFPEKPNFIILTKNVEDFWFSPDGKEIVLYESALLEESGWALKIYDLKRNVESDLISEEDVSSKGADLLDLKFSEDSKEIILKIGIREGTKYFSLKLGEAPPALIETETPSPPVENAVTYQKINNDIYYLDSSGNFFKNEEKLNKEPFLVKQGGEYFLEIFLNFIFLRDGKDLYQFNLESKSFDRFFGPIKNLKISPDENKLVYFSESEIWILFLEDKFDQPPKVAGEKIFLTRVSEKINDIFWLNSDYLIFNSGNKLKIAEIDNRDRINIYDLAEFIDPRIFFNENEKKLYILTEGNLFISDKLIP